MRIQQRVDEPLPDPHRPYPQILRDNWNLISFSVCLVLGYIAQESGFLAWLWMWTTTWIALVVLFWGVQLYYLLQ